MLDNTSHRSDAELKPLVKYVTDHCYHHKLAVIHVRSGLQRAFSQGHARKYHYNGTPSLVTIRLSKALPYPYSSMYRKRAGPAIVHCWQEEFIFVLAHEMRHIDQFWSILGHHRHIEVDAERFAIQVLRSYQLRGTKLAATVDMGYPSNAVGM
jgi:hypothetical protein